MSVSSTSTSASMTDMSAIVSSTVPALFIVPMTAVSPSSMLRRVTMPVDRRLDPDLAQVVARALERGASPAAMRSCCVRTFCSCTRRSACCNLSSFSARSSASRGRQAALPELLLPVEIVLRPASSDSLRALEREPQLLGLRRATPASDASPLSTRVRRFRGSISSRNWPLSTRSPSLTARPVTRPIVSALMLTERLRLDLAGGRHDRLEVALLDRLDVDLDAVGPS